MSRIDILWGITTDYLVHFFYNKIEVTKMPRMFADGQRVALDSNPLKLGRIWRYMQYPTGYRIKFDDDSLSGWLAAGAIRKVLEGAPVPEPLKVGDRVQWQAESRYTTQVGQLCGVIAAMEAIEVVIRRDVQVCGRTFTVKHPGSLLREVPKPLAVGDMVLVKWSDRPYAIIAIHGPRAWLGGLYGEKDVIQPLTDLVRA